MASSGMLRHVAHVRTDLSEELSAYFIRVIRICELGTTLAVTSNRCKLRRKASVVPSSPILVTLMKEVLSSSETSVLTRATRHNIPEDAILHSHRRENFKSYILIADDVLKTNMKEMKRGASVRHKVQTSVTSVEMLIISETKIPPVNKQGQGKVYAAGFILRSGSHPLLLYSITERCKQRCEHKSSVA
jgi:hypothetical protein